MKKDKEERKKKIIVFGMLIVLTFSLVSFLTYTIVKPNTNPSECQDVFVTSDIVNEQLANMIYDSPNCFNKTGSGQNYTVLCCKDKNVNYK